MVSKKQDFSDSERARLQAIAEEKHHEDWLRAKRKSRAEAIRGWVTWITAAWVLKDLLWRDLVGLAKELWK